MKLHLQGTGGNRVEGWGGVADTYPCILLTIFTFWIMLIFLCSKNSINKNMGKTLKQNTNKISLIVFQKKNRTISKCVCWGGETLVIIYNLLVIYLQKSCKKQEFPYIPYFAFPNVNILRNQSILIKTN